MSLLIRLGLIAAAAATVWFGYVAWRESEREIGRNEIRTAQIEQARQDAELRSDDQRMQRLHGNQASAQHAAVVTKVNNQLGVAHETIYRLPGRACLDASTVRVLNGIGVPPGDQPGRAAASGSESAPGAVATDQDVAGAITECRGAYAIVSDQLNKILDIEDRRHPPPAVHTSEQERQ